uniref:Uncharacterized protein n=1 Tax=Ditylenchus dipsaci TaxID=166011 RepID=A0A915DSU1_9BILA
MGGPQSTNTSSVVLPAPLGHLPTCFYAPPPSAASMSTYGVVQPMGMPITSRRCCAESTSSGISNVRRRPPLAASTPKHNSSLASNSNRRRRRQKKSSGIRGREEEEIELVDSYMPPPAYSQIPGQEN